MTERSYSRLTAACSELGKFLINVATAAFILVFVTPFFGADFVIVGTDGWALDHNAAVKIAIVIGVLAWGVFLKTYK